MHFSLKQAPHILRCNWGNNHVGTARFRLDDCWSLLHFNYPLNLQLDGALHQLQAGSIMLAAPGSEKIYSCKQAGRHQFIHFQLAPHTTARINLPAICCDHTQNKLLQPLFDQCIAATQELRHDAAQAHLWHLLHCMAEYAGAYPSESQVHPAALHAAQIIEEGMAAAPSLSEIAQAVHLSPNHLNTIFKQQYGQTVHAHLLQLRVAQAQHLLRHSDLSIRDIAASIGVLDLQAFNKMLRRHLGKSPRALRKS